jgi:murein DD-endopeptidase MepM/ murein hydrolase activator NlpD
MHEGVDIAAPSGSVIRATASGRVAAAGISSSYGRYVEIDHGEGVSSFYAHMSKTAGLRVGAPVAAGGIVGYVGSTGHSTGPHLHFEIRKAGAQYDPSLFMGRAFASYDALPFRRSADLIRASAKGSLHASRAARPLRVAYAGGRVHTSIARG